MKTKQLEQLVIALAGLLIIGYLVLRFAGATNEQLHLMNYGLAAGVAIYIGYSYIIQLRERRQIDGLKEKNDELKHKVADREHTIRQQKSSLDKLNKQNVQLNADLEDLKTQLSQAEKQHQSEIKKLQDQIAVIQSQQN